MFYKGIDIIENKPDWHLWQPAHANQNKRKEKIKILHVHHELDRFVQIMFDKGIGSIDNGDNLLNAYQSKRRKIKILHMFSIS